MYLAEAVLTSTHNLCFGAKIRQIGLVYPCKFQFHCIKVRFKGVFIARTYFPDGKWRNQKDIPTKNIKLLEKNTEG